MRSAAVITRLPLVMLVLVYLAGVAASSYNASIAMNGWYYSKSAFCNISQIIDWDCPTCGPNPGMVDVVVAHNDSTGGRAFAGYNTKTNTVVLSIRGSHDVMNWVYDLDYFFIDYPNNACTMWGSTQCQVHRGFLTVYDSIKDVVMPHVTALMHKYAAAGPGVLVTGHSLGAAVAILAAADVSLAFKAVTQDINIYTFGEPRVGNPAWAKWMSESVIVGGKQYRVTHEADPVPRLPPLEFGFLHVPHEVWYNNDLAGNTFTVCVDNATAEDYTNCENTQYAFVPEDHLEYLGVHAGC